ncbi:HD domain-containing protein [Kitasatospora sp. NPDC004289]
MGGEGAPERLALLIGVGETPAAGDWFPPLAEAVAVDQRLLAAALGGSGYRVEVLRDPTRNEITAALAGLARDAPPGSTVLLHYTGHGIRVGDTDHLVPADARAPEDGGTSGWDQPHVLESLLDADLSRYLTACRAGTVLWLIDACRSAEEEDGTTEFGSRITKGPPEGGFAVMTACAPGQRAGYSAAGSFFTRALADAFDPLTEASTVEELYGTAARLTRQYARRERAGEQDVRIHYGTALEHETRTTPVAQGRRLLESWQEAVYAPGLWARVPAAEAALVTHLQECLTELATEVARQVHLAQKDLPDPWADDDFPVRVLGDRLPRLLPEGVELSALEAAALVAGVFLREAAWAERLSQAARFEPRWTLDEDDAGEQRRQYEQVMARHPEVSGRLGDMLLRELGEVTDHQFDAAVLWLVHRWIAERFETDELPVPPHRADRLALRMMPANGGAAQPSGRVAELSAALRMITAAPVLGEPPEAEALGLPERYPLAGGSGTLRVRALAALLRLAVLFAVDARMLPETVVEHLVVSDPVLPGELLTAVRAADWHAEAGEVHLDAVCPHPAIHETLAAIVEEADGLVRRVREAARRWPAAETALLAGLPSGVTDRRLRADERQGRRAYDVPLLRFTLAQTEVRRLLMGEQLYDGQRHLAVRELYQNAMDACRYRAMRLRYLRGAGGCPAPWEGGIRITVGEDERGRYVECLDNGVGMTVDQLKETFTRAGRRFGQSREFRREQAAWLRQDGALRLYPNSRFGIGVFSYFMLADEMEIVTRPVGPDGYPAARALRVFIPGSASLFRVQELAGADLPEGGTRVRLYLRDGWRLSGAACEELLRSLVLVSEFRLEVWNGAKRTRSWAPGVLQAALFPRALLRSDESPRTVEAGRAVEAVPGTLWWVEGTGAVLCDGIATDKRPFGYVLNLTGPHAGRLSVNRKKLEQYDTEWETEQWGLGAEALAAWPLLTLGWLHELERHHLGAATLLWSRWKGRGLQVRDQYGRSVNLDETGWFRLDRHLYGHLDPSSGERVVFERLEPWRTVALGQRPDDQETALPAVLTGHPVPEPGWASIATSVNSDWRTAVRAARDHGITVAEVIRRARALRIVHPRLSGPAVRAGALDWVPGWRDEKIVEGLLGADRRRWQRPEANDYRHAPGDLTGIVRASELSATALGELAGHCVRYAPFGVEPLAEVPEWHRKHVCDSDDLDLLYQTDGETWSTVSEPWDLVANAARLGVSPFAALAGMNRFSWLGVRVPSPEEVLRWAEVPEDLFDYLRHYVGRDGRGTLFLGWGATVELAADTGISLRKAEKYLAKAAKSLGMEYRRRYAVGGAGRGVVPSEKCGNAVHWLQEAELPLEQGVSLRDLGFVSPSAKDSALVLDELREAGVDVPPATELLTAWEDLPVLGRYVFSGQESGFDGANYPVLPSPPVLFMAGLSLGQSLTEVWRNAREECARLGLPPELAPLPFPEGLADRQPTREMAWALVESGPDESGESEWSESPRWIPLTAEALLRYAARKRLGARTAYRSFAELRAIGALVPPLTDDQVAGLPDTVPTAADVVALSAECRVSERGEPLTPLDLVSIAGRLGEPVTTTWWRLLPYLALESAGEPFRSVPDVLPLWQDLAVLSEGLDGRLPALAGRVDPEWPARAADAVGESAEWVRERLGHYAELFGLELPAPGE